MRGSSYYKGLIILRGAHHTTRGLYKYSYTHLDLALGLDLELNGSLPCYKWIAPPNVQQTTS